MTEKGDRASLLSNVLAVGGLIVLVVIVLWGLIHIVSLGSGWFSGFLPSSQNTIQVSTPGSVTSGEPFSVNWKYAPEEAGTYAMLYQCRNGLIFSGYSETAKDHKYSIPCGSAYTLGGATSSVTLVPTLATSTSMSSVLTLLFLPASGSTVSPPQGSATVVVSKKASSPAPVVTPAQTTPTQTAPPPPVYRGPADLAVTILSSNVDAYGNATVSFDIANVGSGTSGVYYFSAQLPTRTGYTYTSPAQSPLPAGSHITSTLNFTQATPGSFAVSISGGDDVNGANNFATQFINAPYLNYQYQNQPVYSPQPQPYYQPTYGSGQCYYNGATYVCNQPSSYSNGLPYYVNSGQYPYLPLNPLPYSYY